MGTSKIISCLKTSIRIDYSMINSNFEQSPRKKKKHNFFFCIFQWYFFSFWPKKPRFLGTLIWYGPTARSLMTDMLEAVDHLHSYGVLLGRSGGHANIFFFSPHYPQQCEKKTWASLFFSIFLVWKTLPSTFLLEPSCSYCIFRPLGISAKTGMLESPLLFLVAIWAPKFKMWGSRTRCLEA